MPKKGRALPVDVAVGANIRMYRLQRGFSQTDLANQLGVTFQQVQKYEKGSNRVSASRMLQIANALSVAITDFYGGIDTASASTKPLPASALLKDRVGVDVANLWPRLSNEARIAVRDMVQHLAAAK